MHVLNLIMKKVKYNRKKRRKIKKRLDKDLRKLDKEIKKFLKYYTDNYKLKKN
jgi:hypothetical protein